MDQLVMDEMDVYANAAIFQLHAVGYEYGMQPCANPVIHSSESWHEHQHTCMMHHNY